MRGIKVRKRKNTKKQRQAVIKVLNHHQNEKKKRKKDRGGNMYITGNVIDKQTRGVRRGIMRMRTGKLSPKNGINIQRKSEIREGKTGLKCADVGRCCMRRCLEILSEI